MHLQWHYVDISVNIQAWTPWAPSQISRNVVLSYILTCLNTNEGRLKSQPLFLCISAQKRLADQAIIHVTTSKTFHLH